MVWTLVLGACVVASLCVQSCSVQLCGLLEVAHERRQGVCRCLIAVCLLSQDVSLNTGLPEGSCKEGEPCCWLIDYENAQKPVAPEINGACTTRSRAAKLGGWLALL